MLTFFFLPFFLSFLPSSLPQVFSLPSLPPFSSSIQILGSQYFCICILQGSQYSQKQSETSTFSHNYKYRICLNHFLHLSLPQDPQDVNTMLLVTQSTCYMRMILQPNPKKIKALSKSVSIIPWLLEAISEALTVISIGNLDSGKSFVLRLPLWVRLIIKDSSTY